MVVLSVMAFSACNTTRQHNGINWATISYRDIPGITQEEIDAIDALRKSRNALIFSSVYGTEMFVGEDGRIKGFSALLCRWLSEVFEVPFVPTISMWDELIDGLETGVIDFTGEFSANERHHEKYFMTTDMAQRQIITLQMESEPSLRELALTGQTLRYIFLNGTDTDEIISRREANEFEAFFVDNYLQAYALLESGEADAFFAESTAEANFDLFGGITARIYYPIIFAPVSIATQNEELKPIIDVIQRALNYGAIEHFTQLYNQGRQEYLRHKFSVQLTDEEREYIRSNPVIPYAAETTNYPLSFFETRTGEWEGMTVDVLDEIEEVTGLVFERQNDENTTWPNLLASLESGEAYIITSLIPSEDRIGDFLWPDASFFRNHFILVSKLDFPGVSINEILYTSVGIVRDTAHGNLFREWFPNHRGIVQYETTFDAFDALERDEVDMVMVSEHQLLILTNYREQVGYKANFIFDYYFYSTFGINKDQEVLSSIITKAMKVIDVESISSRWIRRTYDYRIRLAQERIPLMVGIGALSVGFVFAVVLFVKKQRDGLKLETIVAQRTKELSEAVELAQEASRAKSDFLSSMSHEIRTPMNAIIGMAELMGHEQLSERQTGYIHDITVSSKSLLGIINDILDFSKIESGKLELNPVDYEPMVLINHIDSMFTYVAGKKELEFKVEVTNQDELPPCLYGDDVRLRQVLTNICGNAVKFTAKGHVKLAVEVNGEQIIFRIEDTGMGIRKEDMPRLFRAFEQLDMVKNRSVVGTGLGLSITKAFVEAMNGNVGVESEYGRGTSFIVTIPIVKGNIENIRQRAADKKEHTVSAPDAKILITDDNEFNLKVASGLLGIMDIKAETADSGFKAIELVQQNDYDIVFMDHMMPEMDGVETVCRIRNMGAEDEKYERLTIIALTANAVKGAREMFAANGFNDFISKPINADELQEIVIKHLPPEKVVETAARAAPTSMFAHSEFIMNLQKVKAIDIELGLSRVSNMENMYRDSVEFFFKKLSGESKKLCSSLEEGDLTSFAITVHAMKSALSTIGAMELSGIAMELETAAKSNNAEFCTERFPALKEKLAALHEQLSAIFNAGDDGSRCDKEAGDDTLLCENIKKALDAADDFDSDLGLEILEDLIKFDFGEKTNAALESAKAAFEDFDCSAAAEHLRLI
jgi:signal transduction histidine kinase/CheY-like chemotaxis protein/HPt (histidine-containing phosphotransfer) domain-containing protein